MWLFRLNAATLTYLELSELDLSFASVIRDISRTISQLRCLQILKLGTQGNYSLNRQALESFFSSCPTSLVRFKVTNSNGPSIVLSLHQVAGDWDYGQGPLVLRDEPLLCLKSQAVPLMPRELMAPPVYRSLLEHCPALETLELPHLGQLSDDMMIVIASLSDLCPHISDLSFLEDCLAEQLMTVLESLPAQQLRRCICVKSTVIQAALTTCGNLEVFKAIGHGDLTNICLKFAHAIEYPWVCTRIRELEIVVWVTYNGRHPEYMKDQSKSSGQKRTTSFGRISASSTSRLAR
ncbi:hypothetical protein BGZ96_006281 [Linnemannia gamsii]|uniref:Uncharacterized protein n=1 Tax=Linnemannia gamsii TaxID=64522 RepID=A0ABQ7K3A2_9FUNG|nr:hypothetical protein BGZ96_006281 [Linnemannia gamsii]